MADLDQLLEKTSRTFALSIPLLPEPTRQEVTLAYLLFRIADTFEDAARWPREKRIAALKDFSRLLESSLEGSGSEATRNEERGLAATWARDLPLEHEGYLELLEEVPFVMEEFRKLSPAGRRIVAHHTRRTAEGMAAFVARTGDNGELALADFEDLRAYCYVVAGIVGEMLTELFLLDREPLAQLRGYLGERAKLFGEALQLVNILKDASFDAREGRLYLPEKLDRDEVFAHARADLEAATEYCLALQEAGAERGLVAFNALPVLLAWATLDRVEEKGPGAKITRPEVWAVVEKLERDLDDNRPAVTVPQPAATGRRTRSAG